MIFKVLFLFIIFPLLAFGESDLRRFKNADTTNLFKAAVAKCKPREKWHYEQVESASNSRTAFTKYSSHFDNEEDCKSAQDKDHNAYVAGACRRFFPGKDVFVEAWQLDYEQINEGSPWPLTKTLFFFDEKTCKQAESAPFNAESAEIPSKIIQPFGTKSDSVVKKRCSKYKHLVCGPNSSDIYDYLSILG